MSHISLSPSSSFSSSSFSSPPPLLYGWEQKLAPDGRHQNHPVGATHATAELNENEERESKEEGRKE